MGIIRALPAELVNQIAAGEVIERPAAVVKELVENALDAGADSVIVEYETGGRSRIRITDTGKGIDPEDLPLAVHSHATSKLQQADDLFNVKTLGFRGEALASIGSVSHLHIRSRTAEGSGAELRVEGGKVGEVRDAACPPGTIMEITNLFFNVPVRRKFLRSPATEAAHINEAMIRFALAWPNVRFELHGDGRREHILPPVSSVAERIGYFFGKEVASDLTSVEIDDSMCRVRAFLAAPRHNRANSKSQYLFVNGRFIRDRMITKAIHEAYKEMIPGGRSPMTFIFLEVNPEEIDVNVHPTKIEIRFRQGWKIFDLLVPKFREALRKSDMAVPIQMPTGEGRVRESGRNYRQSTYSAILDYFQRSEPQMLADAPSGSLLEAPSGEAAYSGSLIEPELEMGRISRKGDRRFFQVHGMYIVEENEEGLLVIDQHALHERLRYEEIRAAWKEGEMPRQRLLVPGVVELTPEEEVTLEEQRGFLNAIGIEISDFGGNSVAVQSLPAFLKDTDPERFLRDFLSEAAEAEDAKKAAEPGEMFLDRMLYFMACRSAIKAGNHLSDEEILRLLEERERVESSGTCVHGRPTSIKLTLSDLERYFHRK